MSVGESEALGRRARKLAPRSSHRDWQPALHRPDPVTQLAQQEVNRLPELLPIRHARMASSPFAFFRGAAAIMAGDLAKTPTSGIETQLCGDAHLANFGGFASPEREMVFDINDFDETLRGPWEWDLKRLVASIHIAGRHRGLSDKGCRRCVLAALSAYVTAMRTFAGQGNLEVWYSRLPMSEILKLMRQQGFSSKRRRRLEAQVSKAEGKESRRAAGKLTRRRDGRLAFVSEPPLIVPVRELLSQPERETLEAAVGDLISSYRSSLSDARRRLFDGFQFLALARKVVGVGSVGTRAWVVLFEGRDQGDPLVLQCKEAQASTLEPHIGASRYANHGQRVVEGQRLMQASSDIFLGWMPTIGLDGVPRDFYLRQLWDGKLSLDLDVVEPEGLLAYGRLCAWTLARAHARSGDRIAIASYLGGGRRFAEALADFATAYADRNERDHEALCEAIDGGRLAAAEA